MNNSNEKRMWSHLFSFSKKYSIWIVISIISTLVSNFSNIYASDLLKNIVNMASSKSFEGIKSLVIIGLIVFIFGVGAKYFFGYAIGKYGNYLVRDIRNATINYIHKLPPDYTMKNKTGEILAKLSGDANAVQNFMANELINIIYMPLMLLSFGVYLAYLNWQLFLASSIILPILIPLTTKLIAPVKKNQREYVKFLGKTNNTVQSCIDGISVIKAFNLEEEMAKRYDDSIRYATNIGLKNDKIEYLINPINSIIGTLPSIICIVYGGYLCLKGNMTAGELMAFLNIFRMFTEPVRWIYLTIINSRTAMVSAERLFSILDEKEEKTGDYILTKEDYGNSNVTIELKDVVFSYDKVNTVLNKFSLTVDKGKCIALVGASGSGKSTILSLICKIYESQKGSIRVCNKNIEEIEVNSLRDNISYVAQSPFLFPFSVKDNILVGKPEATMEEIIEAAKKANAHNFIMELPQGYDTLVGERGTRLSGGQVQRISIARAMLKNAPILLLDEATSALDNKSEALVKEAIDNLKANKTLIVVAHRLSTIENADEILVMDKGTIIEKGTHKDLIDRNSAYAKLNSVLKEAVVGV